MLANLLLPLDFLNPALALFFISSTLTAVILILNRVLIGNDFWKDMKERMEEIREKILAAQKKGDMETVNALMNEMVKLNSEYMKRSIKPLLISSLLILLLFPLFQSKYTGKHVSLPLTLPLIGNNVSWYVWYFLVSISVGWVLKRLMGD